MIKSVTFSDIEYKMRKRTTKREAFLNVMEKIIPWDEWVAYIAPIIPRVNVAVSQKALKQCYACIYCNAGSIFQMRLQKDSIYDSYAMRNFMNISFF